MILRIIVSALYNSKNIFRSLVGYNKENLPFNIKIFLKQLYYILIPTLPFRTPKWIPNFVKKIFFKDDSRYLISHPEVVDNICFLYINGILSSNQEVLNDINKLNEIFNRPINGIYNPTDSFTIDLIESLIDKETNHITQPALIGLFTISKKILDPQIDKVIIIAYSQGTLILSKILNLLSNLGFDKEIYLKKIEIYSIANCSSKMRYISQDLPYMEHFVNENDFIGRLGINCSDHLKSYIKIDGQKILIKNKYGHLLNENYLDNFLVDYCNSKLINYIKTNQDDK